MAYASAAEGGYGSSLSVIPTDASHAESISVPDAELLFRGHFHRAGPDLVLTGHDGRHHLIPGYFAGEKLPALVAPNGARLSPDLVDLLAGSPTPGEYAQAQPTAPRDAIGKVEKVVGDVTVMRNGVAVALHVGDAVYKSDVIQTGANSSVGIGFPDGTALNLVPNTRMALNEYSYDPNGTSNAALFSLVEGTFAFVAGKVAHTGGMNIETPVATMGIRGTTGFVEQVATITATVGNVTYSFAVVDDPGSTGHGQYDLIDANGNIIATVSQTGTVTYVTPQGPGAQPLVQVQAMTAAQVAFEQAIIQQVFQTLNLLSNPGQTSQPPSSSPGSSTPPGELNNLQHLLQENGGNPFTINIPVPGPTGPTNVSGTATITTNTLPTGQPSSTTVDWKFASNGTWETGADWVGGSTPGTSQAAEIDLPVKVTIDEAETVASLIIGATATLNIISNGSLTVANGISNAGVLQLNSSGTDPTLKINGTVYLLDGGEIAMLGPTAENLIVGVPGSGATLVNVDNTIIGSGTIGQGDGALTLVNGSAGLIEAKPLLATDTGILVIDTGNTVSNSGGLEAVAGGTLQIDDPVNNLGTILADGGTVNISNTINNAGGTIEAIGANALVDLSNATVEGGTLFTSGPGSSGSNIDVVVATGANMSVLDGASAGPLTVDGYVGVFQGAQLELQGTIHIDGANGEIDVGGPTNGPTAQPTNLVIDGTVTLDTDGLNVTSASISLDGGPSNTVQIIAAPGGGTLDNVNTMIAGAGNIGAGDPSFLLINEASGVLNASGTTALVIDNASPGSDDNLPANAVVNLGTIEATGSGGLTIEDTTIGNAINPFDNNPADNTGVVQVAAGSHIDLDNGTILFGTVSIAADGEIETVSGTTDAISTANGTDNTSTPFTLDIAGTLAVSDDSSLTLVSPDTIHNTGTIQLNSTGDTTTLTFDQGFAEIDGGGHITLSDSTENVIAVATSGDQLDNFDNTIAGAGTIGSGGMALVNGGTIDADYAGAALTLDPTSLTNTGTLEATDGATLVIDPTTVANTGGTIAAHGDGATVQLADATITGGTLSTDSLTSDSGGVIEVVAAGGANMSVFDGSGSTVTVDGYVQVDSGANLELIGTIHNEGTITLAPGASDPSLAIDGVVCLQGSGSVVLSDSSDNIVGACDDGCNVLINSEDISGAGQIGNWSSELTLINTSCGVIDANSSGSTLTLDTGCNTIINAGTLEANGGILDVNSNVGGCGDVVITGGGTADFADSFNQNVTFTGASAGTLALAQCYSGTVSGFGTGDALDLTNLAYSSCDHVVWTPSAVSSGGEGSGTLAIYNGETLEESIQLDGYYAQNNFVVTDDAGSAEVAFRPGSGLVGEIISPLTYDIGHGSVTDAIGQIPDATFVATDINYNMVPSGEGDIAQFLNANGQNDANSITELTAANVATNSPFSSYYQLDGYIELTAGVTYRFLLSSDDGSTLSINGIQVIGDDGEHPSGNVYSEPFSVDSTGSYPIEIRYFANDYGTSTLLAQYEAGDSGFVDLTSADLFQQPLTPVTVATSGSPTTVDGPASDYVTFAGGTGTLVLNQPETFVGQIAGFTGTAADAAHSDVIDLVGFDAADTTVSASSGADGLTIVTVTDSSGDGLSATLTLVGTYSTSYFVVASDGHGGTDIFDPPATNSGAPVSIGGPGNDNFIFHPSLGADSGNSHALDDAAELERLSAAQAQHWSPLIGNDAHNDAIEFVHHSDGTMPPDSNAAHWHLAMHNAVNLH